MTRFSVPRPVVASTFQAGTKMVFRKGKVSGPDQRKSARRKMRYPAALDPGTGAARLACIVSNISQTGAKLAVANPADIPNEFTLLLGMVCRACRVVWRTDRQIGVQFLAPCIKPETVSEVDAAKDASVKTQPAGAATGTCPKESPDTDLYKTRALLIIGVAVPPAGADR